ncbi:hypothetical protein [Bradyrhizobium sp.]
MLGKLVVSEGDVQQSLSGVIVGDQLGKSAGFGRTLTPVVGREL